MMYDQLENGFHKLFILLYGEVFVIDVIDNVVTRFESLNVPLFVHGLAWPFETHSPNGSMTCILLDSFSNSYFLGIPKLN